MRKIKIYFSLFILMLVQFAQAQNELDSYLKIAANNNPGLKAMFNDYMAAMEQVPQVGTLPDPQATFGYFVQPMGDQRANFGLMQDFPWFGLLGARSDVATNFARAKYEEFENTKSNLFFEVKTAYYNYYFIEKAIEITKENIEILEIFKRLSLVKIEAGFASVVDELRVELELNDLENQLALFLDTKDVFRVMFNNLLDRNENDEILVPDLLWQDDMPLDQLKMLDEIYASNHEIKGLDHRINAFMNQEVVAKKEGLPTFNLGFGYTLVSKNPLSTASDNGKDAFLFPSVGVTIPLYRKKYKALISEARYMQEAEISRKEDKKNTLGTIYENSLKEYKDGNRRIALNLNQSNIAKKILDLLIVTYSTNAEDFEEVLRIERSLLRYQLEYEKALTDKNASIAFMNYLIGK